MDKDRNFVSEITGHVLDIMAPHDAYFEPVYHNNPTAKWQNGFNVKWRKKHPVGKAKFHIDQEGSLVILSLYYGKDIYDQEYFKISDLRDIDDKTLRQNVKDRVETMLKRATETVECMRMTRRVKPGATIQ